MTTDYECPEHQYIYTHEGNAYHTVYHYKINDCPYCQIASLTKEKQIYLKGKLLGGYEDTARKIGLVKQKLRSSSKNARNRNRNNTRKASNRNLFW